MRAEHRSQPLVVLALAPAQGDEKDFYFSFFLKALLPISTCPESGEAAAAWYAAVLL